MTTEFTYPYIPNSSPEARKRLLSAVGVSSVEALYDAIPADLKLDRPLDLPEPLRSEFELTKSIGSILAKNRSCDDAISFLGGGCWQHYVPAVCDEIARRGEFLTAYGGWLYSDHGKYQAMFEYQSLIGELVGMDVVSTPTYDWGAAAASALAMACRITGRNSVLVPRNLNPERLSQIKGFLRPVATVTTVEMDAKTGLMNLDDLASKVSEDAAAVYFENPTYLGVIETQAAEIADHARRHGAMAVVGVDPSSLGVLAAPADYGADIVVGDLQPLGNHMNCGGGVAGFIASRDEERIVSEIPTFLVSIARTLDSKSFGYGISTMDRTSYDKRESSPDYCGTTQWLLGIAAAVYLSLMGPRGMQDLGEGIMQRAEYAGQELAMIPGVRAPRLEAPVFKEVVVDFSATNMSVAQIDAALRMRGIFGGVALGDSFTNLTGSALYSFTEVHTKSEIDTLVDAIKEIVS